MMADRETVLMSDGESSNTNHTSLFLNASCTKNYIVIGDKMKHAAGPLDSFFRPLCSKRRDVQATEASLATPKSVDSNVVVPINSAKRRRILLSDDEDGEKADAIEIDVFAKSISKATPQSSLDIAQSTDVTSPAVTSTPFLPSKEAILSEKLDVKMDFVSNDTNDKNSDDIGSEPAASSDDEECQYTEQTCQFFQEATKDQLKSIARCSDKQIELIFSLRPFENPSALELAFQSTKGLRTALLDNYEHMIHTYDIIDNLVQTCDEQAAQLKSLVNDLQVPSSTTHHQPWLIDAQPAIMSSSISLKQYQLVGVRWLLLLHHQQMNGILADEMGLGKTAQVIGLLSALHERGIRRPHLIVVPASTLENWTREFSKFCPSLRVVQYYGSQTERAQLRMELSSESHSFDVLVTTYTVATGQAEDRVFFKKQDFEYLILDEGHMIKNSGSQRHQALQRFRSRCRLLLTGTPLQNDLAELMALLEFIMPRVFRDCRTELEAIFSMRKELAADSHQGTSFLSRERIERAKKMMAPFVLRRTKMEVLSEMPRKVDRLMVCPMTVEQKAVYASTFSSSMASIQKEPEEKKKKTSEGYDCGKLSNLLMQLRKAANHPLLHRRQYTDGLIDQMAKFLLREEEYWDADLPTLVEDMKVCSDYELHRLCVKFKHLEKFKLTKDKIQDSGKFEFLMTYLAECFQRKDKVLIFSQFTMMLDILEEFLKNLGYRFLRIDGATPVADRQMMIDQYNQNDDIFIFLLSTRAGGLGVNLTSSNTVIIHDIDFNPQNDRQAEDRAHRVGQTREVTVVKLLSEKTIEEKIHAYAKLKLQLDQSLKENDEDNDENVNAGILDFLKDELQRNA